MWGALCFLFCFSQGNSDLPFLKDIKVMGYSLRSWDYRYTLWLGFDPNTFEVGGWLIDVALDRTKNNRLRKMFTGNRSK